MFPVKVDMREPALTSVVAQSSDNTVQNLVDKQKIIEEKIDSIKLQMHSFDGMIEELSDKHINSRNKQTQSIINCNNLIDGVKEKISKLNDEFDNLRNEIYSKLSENADNINKIKDDIKINNVDIEEFKTKTRNAIKKRISRSNELSRKLNDIKKQVKNSSTIDIDVDSDSK